MDHKFRNLTYGFIIVGSGLFGPTFVQQSKIKFKKDLDLMEVVKIEVNDAHTYVLEGVISHNIKSLDQDSDPNQ